MSAGWSLCPFSCAFQRLLHSPRTCPFVRTCVWRTCNCLLLFPLNHRAKGRHWNHESATHTLHDHDRSVLAAAEVAIMESRRDCFAKTTVATVTLRDGLPSWEYMAMPNRFNQSRANDLLRHIYTLWGSEIYRDLNGSVPLSWTREQMLESVEKFWKNSHAAHI